MGNKGNQKRMRAAEEHTDDETYVVSFTALSPSAAKHEEASAPDFATIPWPEVILCLARPTRTFGGLVLICAAGCTHQCEASQLRWARPG